MAVARKLAADESSAVLLMRQGRCHRRRPFSACRLRRLAAPSPASVEGRRPLALVALQSEKKENPPGCLQQVVLGRVPPVHRRLERAAPGPTAAPPMGDDSATPQAAWQGQLPSASPWAAPPTLPQPHPAFPNG